MPCDGISRRPSETFIPTLDCRKPKKTHIALEEDESLILAEFLGSLRSDVITRVLMDGESKTDGKTASKIAKLLSEIYSSLYDYHELYEEATDEELSEEVNVSGRN